MIKALVFVITLFSLFLTLGAQAQDSEGGGSLEYGFLLGNILPNQIDGATEITPQAGLRAGWATSPTSAYEFTANFGNGEGVEWKQLSASARMSAKFEDLLSIVYLGLDGTQYEGTTEAGSAVSKFAPGGHVGGGVMTVLSRDLWMRVDMKFNFNPGTSLFISLGFFFKPEAGGE